MSTVHPVEEDLVMFYYREGGSNRDELQAHLDSCPACHAAYQRLVKVLGACDDLPVPEPHLAFESRMWNRMEPKLHPLHRRVGWQFLHGWLNSRWVAATAVAALLLIAFFAGRISRPGNPTPKVVAITADGRQRVLLVALGDHLERSQMVLTELANAPDQTADLSLERERARSLISENRLYRQTSVDAGDPALAQLLDDLERVLLDISHGSDSREIKSRIDAESLIFKLRVLAANLNRTNVPPPPVAAPHLPSKETL